MTDQQTDEQEAQAIAELCHITPEQAMAYILAEGDDGPLECDDDSPEPPRIEGYTDANGRRWWTAHEREPWEAR
jgi:hypothetical protein